MFIHVSLICHAMFIYHLKLARDTCLCYSRKVNNYTIYLDDPSIIKAAAFGDLFSVRAPTFVSSLSNEAIDGDNDYQVILRCGTA